MKIVIVAVGRARAGAARDLFDDYAKRSRWPLSVREVELRKAVDGAQLKSKEGELLLDAIGKGARVVALDERGTQVSSADFAKLLGAWRDDGVPEVNFVIGGADGLDDAVRKRADKVISLGRVTWPHMLVRGLLAEQVYRAQQILSGHPYHRE